MVANGGSMRELEGLLLDLAPHGLAVSERSSRLVRLHGLAIYYGCPKM